MATTGAVPVEAPDVPPKSPNRRHKWNQIKSKFPNLHVRAHQAIVPLLAATKAPVCPKRGEHKRIARTGITDSLYYKLRIYKVFPPRCLFAFLAHCAFAIIYGLNVVMSFAIVTMVTSKTGVVAGSDCPEHTNDSHEATVPGKKFSWDSRVQGYVLSAYFYGYLVSQIPGAVLADMFSAKWVMWFALLIMIIGCALTPIAAAGSWIGLVVVRVFQGLAGGVTFPAMHIMISNWAPSKTRSVFTGIIYAGMPFGMIGSTLISAFVSIAIGWENMFYLLTGLCSPWLLLWALFIEDTPRPTTVLVKNEAVRKVSVSEERRKTIVEVTPHHTHLEFPTEYVFRSMPFWAILVAHFGGNCGLYCLITQIPTFMKHALHTTTSMNAISSVIPFVAMFIVSNLLGFILDVLRNKNKINTTTARKIGATISVLACAGLLCPVACLIALTFIDCSVMLATLWMTCALGGMGAQTVTHLANHIDISPNYAGMLMGITNTVATIPGMLMPTLFGMLTHEDNSVGRWAIGFYAICGILVIAYIFYMVFASGEVQPWNYHVAKDAQEEEMEERLTFNRRASMALMAATPPIGPATDPDIADLTDEEEEGLDPWARTSSNL